MSRGQSGLRRNSRDSTYWVSGYPKLVAEWHPTRNGDLRPEVVSYGSAARIWWKCPAGPDHEWLATPNSRTSLGNGCPFCAGRRASVTNTLATRFPELAAEWNAARNEEAACDVVAGSSRRAWWKCARDPSHEWYVAIATRVRQGTGCPFCAGRRVTPDRSLAARAPEIAAEWHPTLNAPLVPRDVAAGSNRRVWWRCAEGHEWEASVSSRAGVRRTGCRQCPRPPTRARSAGERAEPPALALARPAGRR